MGVLPAALPLAMLMGHVLGCCLHWLFDMVESVRIEPQQNRVFSVEMRVEDYTIKLVRAIWQEVILLASIEPGI